jgi:hypothetical protein
MLFENSQLHTRSGTIKVCADQIGAIRRRLGQAAAPLGLCNGFPLLLPELIVSCIAASTRYGNAVVRATHTIGSRKENSRDTPGCHAACASYRRPMSVGGKAAEGDRASSHTHRRRLAETAPRHCP